MSNKGASLVEALISFAIISFVIVTILGGLSQQQLSTRKNADKNAAVILAEQQMEELLKFPSTQLTAESFFDYVVQRDNDFIVTNTKPTEPRHFMRTVTITKDLLQQMATIEVLVEYGATRKSVGSSTLIYPFDVVLRARRSLK